MGADLKHVRVRNYLRMLAIEELRPGAVIPSERLLTEKFGVSRMTVRQAVDALVVEGVLFRVRGSGTYVARPKVDLQVRLSSYTEEMRRRGMTPSSRSLAWERVPAEPKVASALEIADGDPVIHSYRLRLADHEPMAVSHVWLRAERVPGLFEGGCPRSLYEALDDFGLLPEWGEDMVDTGQATSEEAELLGVPDGSPLLRIQRRAFAKDQAVELSRTAYRSDRYTLWVPVARPKPPYVRHDRPTP